MSSRGRQTIWSEVWPKAVVPVLLSVIKAEALSSRERESRAVAKWRIWTLLIGVRWSRLVSEYESRRSNASRLGGSQYTTVAMSGETH